MREVTTISKILIAIFMILNSAILVFGLRALWTFDLTDMRLAATNAVFSFLTFKLLQIYNA